MSAIFLFCSGTTLSAQTVGGGWDTLYRWYGEGYGDTAGKAVAGVGDVDSDGVTDLAVGAPGAEAGPLSNVGKLWVFSGATGGQIYVFEGTAGSEQLGRSVVSPGDMDGDGVNDIAVGAPGAEPGGLYHAGSVYIYSGATGLKFMQLDGSGLAGMFGTSLAAPGDVDQDAVPDLLVSAPNASPNGVTGAGAVYLISGATGSVLHLFEGEGTLHYFGDALAAPGDIDGDSVGDVFVGALWAEPNGLYRAGSAYLFSGATYGLIHRFDGTKPDQRYAEAVGGAGDIDGDGVPDLLVGAQADDPGGASWAGSAWAFSGATGSEIHHLEGAHELDRLGSAVGPLGDMDNDGVDDFFVSGIGTDPGGVVHLVSGATGGIFYTMGTNSWGEDFGDDAAGVGDIDGDGVPDVLVGVSDAYKPGGGLHYGAGMLFTRHPFLTTSAPSISVSAGGVVDFYNDFSDYEAGMTYIVLASTTGTGPINIFGLDVPLTPDQAFLKSLTGSLPLFSGQTGQLDAYGDAVTTLAWPAGLYPNLAGTTVYFAAVSYEPPADTRVSSKAVTLDIVP